MKFRMMFRIMIIIIYHLSFITTHNSFSLKLKQSKVLIKGPQSHTVVGATQYFVLFPYKKRKTVPSMFDNENLTCRGRDLRPLPAAQSRMCGHRGCSRRLSQTFDQSHHLGEDQDEEALT